MDYGPKKSIGCLCFRFFMQKSLLSYPYFVNITIIFQKQTTRPPEAQNRLTATYRGPDLTGIYINGFVHPIEERRFHYRVKLGINFSSQFLLTNFFFRLVQVGLWCQNHNKNSNNFQRKKLTIYIYIYIYTIIILIAWIWLISRTFC